MKPHDDIDKIMAKTGYVSGLDTALGDHIYSGGELPQKYFSLENVAKVDKMVRAKALRDMNIVLPEQLAAALFEEMQEVYFDYLDDSAMMGHTRKMGNWYKDTAGEYFTNTDKYEERGSLSPKQRGLKQVDMRTLMKQHRIQNFSYNFNALEFINGLAVARMMINLGKNLKHKNNWNKEFTVPFADKHRFSTHPIMGMKFKGPNKNGPNELRGTSRPFSVYNGADHSYSTRDQRPEHYFSGLN